MKIISALLASVTFGLALGSSTVQEAPKSLTNAVSESKQGIQKQQIAEPQIPKPRSSVPSCNLRWGFRQCPTAPISSRR